MIQIKENHRQGLSITFRVSQEAVHGDFQIASGSHPRKDICIGHPVQNLVLTGQGVYHLLIIQNQGHRSPGGKVEEAEHIVELGQGVVILEEIGGRDLPCEEDERHQEIDSHIGYGQGHKKLPGTPGKALLLFLQPIDKLSQKEDQGHMGDKAPDFEAGNDQGEKQDQHRGKEHIYLRPPAHRPCLLQLEEALCSQEIENIQSDVQGQDPGNPHRGVLQGKAKSTHQSSPEGPCKKAQGTFPALEPEEQEQDEIGQIDNGVHHRHCQIIQRDSSFPADTMFILLSQGQVPEPAPSSGQEGNKGGQPGLQEPWPEGTSAHSPKSRRSFRRSWNLLRFRCQSP